MWSNFSVTGVDDDHSVEKAPPPRFENPDERSASGTKADMMELGLIKVCF